MPLEIQTATIQPGSTKSFNFSNLITQRAVGISAYQLSYGNSDHHVKTMSISLSLNQSGSTLSVTPHATLVDASGNNLSLSNSSITVVAVAWVGVDDSNLKLTNVYDIQNGGSSGAITIPGFNPNILQAGLAGFELSYGNTDHHLETASAAVGTTLNGDTATVNGVVFMYDGSGNSASTANVDGCLIANTDPSLGAYVIATDSLQNGTQTLTFPSSVTKAMPLLSNFKVQFNSNRDHHVKTIAAKLNIQSQTGSSVVVTGSATLTDDSGNNQDNDVSHVSGFVIGY